MSFINKLSTLIPFSKKEETIEYFFALNIGSKKLSAALWTIQNHKLQILQTAEDSYSAEQDILTVTDKLLDAVLGDLNVDPQKILFGVPDSWLTDSNLKDEYLKLLRKLVKDLELSPMAYVASSHAVVHLIEKKEGIPITAIILGFEKEHIEVIVSQAGKVVASKLIERGENSGVSIEKALLSFSSIETLPSKMLLYGLDRESLHKLKTNLLAHPWMSKLSFLHFPKIELLEDAVEIDSICLAGASELDTNIIYAYSGKKPLETKKTIIEEEKIEEKMEKRGEPINEFSDIPEEKEDEKSLKEDEEEVEGDSTDFGFKVGDVAEEDQKAKPKDSDGEERAFETPDEYTRMATEENIRIPDDQEDRSVMAEAEDYLPQEQVQRPALSNTGLSKKGINLSKRFKLILGVIALIFVGLIAGYIFIPKANIQVYVEPKILEKDAQVVADPKQTKVDEEAKVIPAQIVETEVTGSSTAKATGSKQIGDPAKGTVIIINNTAQGQNLTAGTILTGPGGLKFKLDSTASVSATVADADSKSTITVNVTSSDIGPDSNLPSGTKLTIGGFNGEQVVAKSQGNFSGGTSKQVTVVSSDDQKKLLAALSAELRLKAKDQLQEKSSDKKILEEALNETIIKRTYNKNVNDQASEFSLTMTADYKGSAFDEKDLKLIVGKLVTTQVPDGFNLDISETETQADVSSVEKDGRVIFLAKFRAKLVPRVDVEAIKNKIKGKTLAEVDEILKNIENVLGSDIKFTPNLPAFLQRVPFISKNITISVGLK